MSLLSWLRHRTSPRAPHSRVHPRPAARFQLHLEALEGRTIPSTFYAATASDLIGDIQAANQQSGANTIVLTAALSGDTVTITGKFAVANAPGKFTIELFAGPGGPNDGGRYFLASLVVSANQTFSVKVSAALFAGQKYVVATVTDGKNYTSAFSPSILVTGGGGSN